MPHPPYWYGLRTCGGLSESVQRSLCCLQNCIKCVFDTWILFILLFYDSNKQCSGLSKQYISCNKVTGVNQCMTFCRCIDFIIQKIMHSVRTLLTCIRINTFGLTTSACVHKPDGRVLVVLLYRIWLKIRLADALTNDSGQSGCG